MKLYLDACERIAKEDGATLAWLTVARQDPLAALPHAKDLVAQFEAAIRTVLIHATATPVRIVFLLSQSGQARHAEGLIHGTFRQRITATNFIAACEVTGAAADSASRDSDDAVVVWIDDLGRAEPFFNPYASRKKAFLFRHCPVLLDLLRQARTDRANRAMIDRIVDLRHGKETTFFPSPPVLTRQERGTVLFCLYWLDFGGAEAFAIQALAAAKQQGYRVIVTCDEPGRHHLLARAHQHADAIYLIGSFGNHISKEAAILRVIRKHRPDVIHIHHSWVAYRLLPVIRALGLVRGVVDTTHILEHRFAGFVGESALYSEFVDRHHVISQDLADFLTKKALVDPNRIRLGRLHDLSKAFTAPPGKWDAPGQLTVAFVGRFVQQKRPYLFVAVARALVRRFGRSRFRFQAVGEGQLRFATEDLARHAKLGDAITFLPGSAPVPDILGQAHVLLVPSDNEGLTLVAFEAIRAQCLVVSCDVGAQREIVVGDLLVPRRPDACVKQMVALVSRLAEGRLDIPDLLRRQEAMLQANLVAPTGADVSLQAYREILEAKDIDVPAA